MDGAYFSGNVVVPGLGFRWRDLFVAAASLVFVWCKVRPHIPLEIEDHIAALVRALFARVTPYVTVTIDEHAGDTTFGGRSELYLAAESYLGAACSARARRLRADLADGSDRVSLAVGDNEEVVDEFRGGGARMWWRKTAKTRSFFFAWTRRNNDDEEERRAYELTFHRRHRGLVEAAYLPHVLAEGRAAAVRNRQRRLFTNSAGGGGGAWSHVKLDHPASFAKLAMDPAKKQDIIDDLEMFRDGKEYYAKVGKAWKRGYLLYGPPGTGKSTMIAAMANFLDYDVYDLELTAVKINTELRKLFIETTGKSIIIIEDIDCSVDLTGKRNNTRKKKKKQQRTMIAIEEEEEDGTKVTLSGLLNFIDGLWSACGGERIIVFTTNHKEKLDPALIRRGRMDMRIEMSYCRFQAFKVLAKNYLDIDDHELFGEIRRLLEEEVDMTPADVAENLMPRSKKRDVHATLAKLIATLNNTLMMPRQHAPMDVPRSRPNEE
ncbi:hypothetical protein PR202_gb24437 [Eleusine coracana subsp. coracana]|uniref:AAA+ ATPase domain-containing protein n=1 Tax=Eleusine coracana subsp. coracana TaxID=191504 RepID=A0AAV5FL80_ELECO|nr:hypothetical protein PR202_gb24437 [Eleusine coracana subsp. coracana]